MTTDAKKKGDAVDLFIDLKKQGLIGQPSHISDYPETVLNTLRIFVKVFGLPNGAIPSKRSRLKFAMWIKGLEDLQKICATDALMEECMKTALSRFEQMGKPFIIYQPQSVRNLLVDVVSERNRLLEQQKEVEELHNQEFVDGKTINSRLGDLLEEE